MTEARTPSTIDAIAEDWVRTMTELDPTIATYIGAPGRLGEYGDYSPAGHDEFSAARKRVERRLKAAKPVDGVDEITKTDLLAELSLAGEFYSARWHLRDLNVLASPAQEIREVFDLMPTETVEDWTNISGRLGNLPTAVDQYIQTLRKGIVDGVVPARRQVRAVIEQTMRHASADGFFPKFAASAPGTLPESLRSDLNRGAAESAAAYQRLTEFLGGELDAAATETDAVGRDVYALHSRAFLGATIDLDETYEWGIDELARMTAEQISIAHEIRPGASVDEAIGILDADPSTKLHGTDALQRWMQQLSDAAVDELSRTQFDIPDEIKRLECLIAPTQDGGIYYTGPSDDFSRPGRMWWSVPVGETEFSTWRETTTVYHEGVPGHHLQIGQAVVNRGQLNTWRRQLAGTSGHAEGWALYAERLMQELGYLDDPGDRMGMLGAQRMRAARVVLDLGVHLGKRSLDGSGHWDFDYALAFFRANYPETDATTRFEVNRYFGWPGQAPSYKVGQRIWEQLRDERKARDKKNFDIRAFHRDALALGGVGLDTLRSTLLK